MTAPNSTVSAKNARFSNAAPFALIAGPCQMESRDHAMMIAERINQLGGEANFNPEGLLSRSSSQFVKGDNLVEMIKEDLIAERIAVQTYQELIRYFATHDPTTRRMLEEILATEEEHANDMHDLLVAREGKPMLNS